MFQIRKGEPLLESELTKILTQFQTDPINGLPYLQKCKNYYLGKQKILQRQPKDKEREITNACVNFCKQVADSYLGYLAGKEIQYSNIDPELLDILLYNDLKDEDTNFLADALIYGKAFEIVYRDSDNEERFKLLDPRTCIEVVSSDLDEELQYVIRFWQTNLVEENQPVYTVEVYGNESTKIYQSTAGFSSFILLEEKPNYYNQVPITVFKLNNDCRSIFDQVMGLNDDYNQILSDSITDYQAFADAYLILKGQFADEEQLASMRRARCLMIDTDSDVSYLQKDTKTEEIDLLLKTVRDEIFHVSQAVDLADDSFNASTGIALKLKLIGMENQASAIESRFKKALQKRLEILCSVLNLLGGDANWRDVKLLFTRNIPTILTDTVEVVNALRDVVSRETLISLLPFVDDVEFEMKKIKEEQESIYGDLFLNGTEENS